MNVYVPHLRKEPFVCPQNISGQELLRLVQTDMGTKEAEDSIALSFSGQIHDLSQPIPENARVEWITRRDPRGLEILRHTAAHVLAQAVQELFPGTHLANGPAIENGFYHDFFSPQPFQVEDLPRIQQRMMEIVARALPIVREEWSREAAIAFFQDKGETLKADMIQSFPPEEVISFYRQGDFSNLCRGPHLSSTAALGKAFQLTKVSGAYWLGDANNAQLQRIYGTAWATPEELESYLTRLSEAEKRDHRKLAKEMDLFHFQAEAPGSVFWHPHGWTIYRALQTYIRETLGVQYQEINTPQMVSCSLWQKSGHWDVFRDNMVMMNYNDLVYALKPMSCPCHIQIFNQGLKSYRDLPLRYAEFGRVTREEPSGALSGLMRLRAFVQDDGHIFCTPEHLIQETQSFCQMLFEIYHELGFQEILVRLSTRPDKRIGSDEVWDQAEAALREGADAAKLSYVHFPKEGAFYGPKLEFVLKDSLGRLWQCGTLQVDFMMPERLGAFYTDEEGKSRPCVLLHRAILGSMERFIGILLEHTGGRLPLWLAPVQVVVATISEKALDYGQLVASRLQEVGIRVVQDFRPEKIGYKIREHSLRKVPCMLVLGAQEAEHNTVSVRWKGVQETLSLDDSIACILQTIQTKGSTFSEKCDS